MTTFANFIKQPTHPRPAVSDPLILGSPSGWFGPETMIGASAVQILRRSIAAALLGLSLLLGLAAPDEAHAQTSCNVSDATTQATNAYNYHRNNAAGNAPTATAAYRVLIALGGTLPAWSGTNISSISTPTTPISEAELRTFLTGRSDTWAGWNPVYTALNCLEAALPTITISGGPAVTEGAGAQFTVNISPAQGSSVTVNLTVSDVAGSDYVASSNQGSQTVSIPANQTSATHTVPTVNDQSDEANGDVTVTVIGGGVGDGYKVGATAAATVRVNDNDEPAGERHLLISNIGQAGNNNSSGSLNVDRAQAFTTGSHKPGYTVNSVDIVFESNSLSDLFRTPNPRLAVTIRNASNGIPGTTVGTLNLPASSPTFSTRRSITFAAPTKGIQLSPSTTYFLMIDIDAERSTTGETDIWLVDSDAEDAGGAAGFSITNESQMYAWSVNAWESVNSSFQMRVKGEPNPITDLVQMRNATRNIAEFGNHKGNGGIRVLVEIGDGMSRQGYARTINYTVDGKANRGDGKDYTIDGCTHQPCSVRLPANRHSVPITIYVNDDGLDENEETIILTLQDGSGYTVDENRKTTTVTIRDDDTRGLMFHRRWPDVDEGGSETYTLKLASQPTAAVTIKIDSNNQDVTASPTSLTFNPSGSNLWSRTQTVTVSAAQDSDAVDDEATLTHTTTGGDYGGAGAMSIERPVSVDDDDTADPFTPQVPQISLTGGPTVTEGAAASFRVNADPAPTARLTVSVEVIEPPGQDFVTARQERVKFVSLNAGATTATFSVPTVNDSTDEDDGAVQVFVNDGAGYVAGQGAAVTVLDNDDPIPGAFFRSTSSDAVEQDGTHRVQVYLNYPAPAAGLRLRYRLTGTATAGSGKDFTIQNSGTVSIAARGASATIPVAINDDSAIENAETVILTLIGGTGYTVDSPSVHTLTIADNDSPTASFASSSSRVAENAGTHNVTVNISPAPVGGLTLGYSVTGTATAGSGNDFTIQNSGSLTIAAGATSATIPVAINDDSADEVAETVILTLTDGTGYMLGSTTTHTLTITDNDGITSVLLTPLIPSNTIPEGASVAITGVFSENNRHLSPKDIVTLPLTIGGTATLGTDYRLTCGPVKIPVVVTCNGLNGNNPSITFDASRLRNPFVRVPGSLHLEALEDNMSESNETVTLSIGGGPTRTMTITEAPSSVAVSFTRATYSINEGASPFPPVITVTPASGHDLTIPLIFTDVSATGGADYTAVSQVVLEADGNTRYSFDVPIADDTAIEGDETFKMAIDTANLPAGVTAGTATEATVTIVDNDYSASFASGSSRAAEDASTHNVTVNLSFAAPAGGLTLNYSVGGTATAGSGNDFTIEGSGSLTVAAGATSANIPVAINDDSADEVAETVILTLSDGTGYMLGSTTTHTLTITDNDGITSVLLTPLIPSNTIPEGAGVAITGVFSENNRHLSPKDIVTLPLTIGGTATLGTDYRMTCGPVKIPVVVTCNGLNGNNPSITFDASRLRNPFVRVPGSLHLEALEDNTSESNETVTLSIGGGPTRTMTITEAPSSVAVSFTRATYSINEGASPLPPVVTVTPASGRDLTIPLIFTNISATGGADYTAVSQVVLEADGNTRYSFDVPIADDTAIEGDETFKMAIDTANLPAGVTAGTATEATVTIVDNDYSASFASGSSRAAEDAGTHNVTVNLSFAAPAGGLTLNYSVGGTATAGSGNDFTIEGSGSLTVAAGATSATVPVAINDDSADEVAETVILTLSDGTGYTLGSTTTHTLTITDNDGITSVLLTPLIPSNTIPEGASVSITGVFSENNRHLSPKDIVTLPLTIGGTATLGTDYRLTCGPVKIPVVVTCNGLNGNNPSITFDASRLRNPFVRVPGSLHLEALEDNTSESNETVTLSIGGGPTRTMTITEAPSSVAVSFTRATYSINEGASPLPPVITVTPASGRDLTIPLIFTNISATGGADYTAVSQVVLEADGNTRYSFDVPIVDDTAIEGDETFKMAIDTANLPAGVTAGTTTEATVTIVDNDPVPVAHWKFDGDVDDSAGSSNGSAMNGASFTTTATIGSHALVLDGSDDHVNLTPHVTKFPLGNAARSISGWFKADAGNQRQTFLTYGPNIEGKRLSIAADRTQALVAVSGHAWGVNNLSLAEGWHHIAVTFAGGQSDDFSIYLDGALQSASTLGGVARQVDTRTGTAAIGRNVGGTAHYGGEIDDVRLYDFALSLKQVQAMAAWREDVQPAAAALPMRAPMGLVVRGWSASDMSWGMSGTTAVDVEAPEAGVRRQVPLLPSASNPQHAGLVRIVNPTARAGRVRILAVDDTGRRSDPVVLGMGARETLEFTSRDLEWGGAAFDPEESTGPGMGNWRLEIESDLEVEVSGYVRAADGTLSEMGGAAAPSADNVRRLALFHPADSSDAASLLRLTNRGGQALVANITGIDDTGASPGGVVSVEVGAHGSVMLTASELESGGADLLGALGDGGGAWRLDVASDGDLAVMNLVETPDGHLANLSNAEATPVPAGVVHGVAGFPSGAVESGEVGVLRIVNGSGVSGSIRIRLHDGVGWRYAPLTLSLGAGEAVNLSVLDLELGNTSKGLIGSAGPGSGSEWRLEVSGDIDIEVMALVRLPSGLLEALP